MNRITESTIQYNRAALVTQRGTAGQHRIASSGKYDFRDLGLLTVCLVSITVTIWGGILLFNIVDGKLSPTTNGETSSTQIWDSKALGGLPLTQNDTPSFDPTKESTQPPTITTEVFVVCRLLPDTTPSAETTTVLTPNRYLTSEILYNLEQHHTYRGEVMDGTYLASTPQDLGPSTDSEQAECDVW